MVSTVTMMSKADIIAFGIGGNGMILNYIMSIRLSVDMMPYGLILRTGWHM